MLKLHRWYVGLRGLTCRPPWGRSIRTCCGQLLGQLLRQALHDGA